MYQQHANGEGDPDKLFKVHPIIDALKEPFQMIVPTENICIDEKLVPSKSRSKLKQCNPQNR